MAVLVTRPGEQGSALCSLLERHGILALHHPLIDIIADLNEPYLSKHIKQAKIIIAVSQHAVQCAEQILVNSNNSWPKQAIYLAVGQKTAHYLSKYTQQKVHYPQVSDSEHLLQLPALHDVEKQTVLILRGNGGRELIKDALVQRGAKVHYSETYKREFIPFDPVSCVSLWKKQQIDQIIVTSGEQLDYLCSQLTSEQLAWLNQQELYIPSQRIADIAIQRGFTRVRCTGSASNQKLLAALQP
ncbi:uroporphyrinogen-III synthase [Vibrio sp. PNB23_22_6]|jgi:uroporphyrinogen-III synthase|uniref:uroporphyrinogen-III synthase n=1 Tax=Vibrio TaxID=662 RepID=UPI000BFF7E5A|nr:MULTISPECIES: uroporphyrinogen-III synthase [unclassified Vibrio]PHJ40036.1 uroporphyrinogen-III synthase [Vibrio sp. PID17_43]RIZ51218.1 uroporphyrinogen-III synthase [Vibrio sp. PID23_8]